MDMLHIKKEMPEVSTSLSIEPEFDINNHDPLNMLQLGSSLIKSEDMDVFTSQRLSNGSQEPYIVKAGVTDEDDKDETVCRICNKRFQTLYALTDHFRMEHNESYAMEDGIQMTEEQTNIHYYDCNVIRRNEPIADVLCSNDTDTKFKQNFESMLIAYDDQHAGSQKKPWTRDRILEIINIVRQPKGAVNCKSFRTPMEYYWVSKYDILTKANEEILIFKRKHSGEPTITIIPREEYFNVLKEAHEACGHGGRDKILQIIKTRFYIPKKAVEIFINLCPKCEIKRNVSKPNALTRPNASKDFNIKGRVGLIDLQSCPDGVFNWLLTYQDNSTEFLNLRPLKTNTANEVTIELMKIFMTFGAPCILQSDNSREFTAEIVKELVVLWPECKIVSVGPESPKTEGSVDRCNQDIEDMLRSWINDKKSTNWSVGCFYVQYQRNTSFHREIGASPYKSLFGNPPKAGLSDSTITPSILRNIETEEQLRELTQQDDNPNDPNDTLQDSVINGFDKYFRRDFEFAECKSEIVIDNNHNKECGMGSDIEHNSFTDTSNVDIKVEQATHENEIFGEKNKNSETEREIDNLSDLPYSLCNEYDEDANRNENSKLPYLEPMTTCLVCHNSCTPVYSCSSCYNFVHAHCGIPEDNERHGQKILCFSCKVERDILAQRDQARRAYKRAEGVLIENTGKKLQRLKVGATVLIKVPKLCRGPSCTMNIKGKIVEFRNGVYKVGTNAGTVRRSFTRRDLKVLDEEYANDVSDALISLREAVAKSIFGGESAQSCACKPGKKRCGNNRCACFKNKSSCGPKCHSRSSCINK